jgi:RNA polymerase sigma factor (sigma-70 family)
MVPHLVGRARSQLWGVPAARDEAEDAAQSAVRTFLRRWDLGQFRKLDDVGKLYALLTTIVKRKAQKNIRKRRKGVDEAALGGQRDNEDPGSPLEDLAAITPSHEFELLADELLATLPDDKHRQVLCMLFEGATQAEIAQKFGCTERNVRYKIERIREIWTRKFADPL